MFPAHALTQQHFDEGSVSLDLKLGLGYFKDIGRLSTMRHSKNALLRGFSNFLMTLSVGQRCSYQGIIKTI